MKAKILTMSLAACAATGSAQAANYVPNRIIVKSQASVKQLAWSLKSMTLNSGAITPLSKLRSDVAVLRFSTGISAPEAAAEISAMPGVEWAQPDYLYYINGRRPVEKLSTLTLPSILQRPFEAETQSWWDDDQDEDNGGDHSVDGVNFNDPELVDTKIWGMFKIEAPQAWTVSQGSAQVIVADIDTGVDYNHPDLKDNIWTNPDTTAVDQHGYDFANKDSDPMDDNMHGTHTAGTIGARGNNGIGIVGVSPTVSLLPVKFIAGSGEGSTSDAILGIDYAIAKGARVLSNSWGGPAGEDDSDRALEEAVTRAGQKNVLFVAAAGNDGTDNDETPMYPAAIKAENVLAVAASNTSDKLSFFSNYGKESVDVAAPGSNIYSTVPKSKYAKLDGTSMACPHVAGLAALMLAANPNLSALQLKKMIMETVYPISSMDGKIASGGRINAYKAVMRAKSGI